MKLKCESAFSCFPCHMFIILAVIFAIFAGLLFATICGLSCKKNDVVCKDGLCVSQSVFVSEIGDNVASVNLPPNSAITKILVTIIQEELTPIDAGVIQIAAPFITFETYFPKALGDDFVTYELDFIHPYCIGEEEATVFLIPLNNQEQAVARRLGLNVFYYPEACVGVNGGG